MIAANLQVRHAAVQDHRQISALLFQEANTHRHLDWRTALEWLGSPNYWILENQGQISAALACPEDPEGIAWIRLFSYHPHLSMRDAWSALWGTARAELTHTAPHVTVAAIVLKQWFQNLLLSEGFTSRGDIVVLRLHESPRQTFPVPHGIRIRLMNPDDLPVVANLDAGAFGPFWANSLDSLQRAYSQSTHATVAEDDTGVVVGYQLSTGNPFGAHLARLAVHTEAQGRGVGSALLDGLIRHLGVRSTFSLSVNTQSNNIASLALYKKMGFIQTGEYFPVFSYEWMTSQ